MKQYTVRSGQNIYDVSLTIYGTVEGIFDLLISNEGLTMDTKLSYGMVLNYHEEFIINRGIVSWLKDNDVLVKNGEHVYNHIDVEATIKQHIYSYHQDKYDSLQYLSPDEKNMFWEEFISPRMVIQQQGQISTFNVWLKGDTHMIIDWGDYSEVQIVDSTEEVEIEHCYKSAGSHKITMYGDFKCYLLDLRMVNGVHYPLSHIYADDFMSELNINDLDKLIITNEKR